ncbi:MAG: hypothetical protein SGJ02_11295 [bacterium]|nr:hypothetical protein [bacterium]
MGNTIIERLFTSFADLESAIHSAKNTLVKKGNVPNGIMERIGSYDEILLKQRQLASKLCDFINRGDWDEVGRHVSLINGLSSMIRDDARSMLSVLSGASTAQEETKYC